MDSPLWNRLEIILAALLIGLALMRAGQTMGGMLTTSLSTDEFGTIGTFSSKGPARVLTDYRAPKNHIFFNLLNSVLPGRESLNPARARALSILATILTAGCLIAYSVYRRQVPEAAFLLALWSTAPEMLGLSMEARGYGFLGLFAVVAAMATIEFFRSRRTAWLVTLAVSCALGVYTIPGFLFFAGPLLLLTWIVDRTKKTFLFGAGTALAILLLYLPVIGQLWAAFHDFQGDAESDFETPTGILHALKLYLLSCDDWEGWLFLGAMAVAPFALPPWSDRADRKGRMLVAGACVAFLGILLILQSPPVRMAAFVFLPLAFVGILSIGKTVRLLPGAARTTVFGGLCLFLIVDVGHSILYSRFTPSEDWLLAGRAIDAAFPPSVKVDYKRFAKYLKQTMPDSEKRLSDFDAGAFADGSLIVADAGNKWAEGRRFVPPEGTPRVMEWTVEGAIRDVVLSFVLPEAWSDSGAPAPAHDGKFETGETITQEGLHFTTKIPEDAKALVLLLNRPVVHRDILVQMNTGKERKDLTANVLLAGNGIILPADNLAGTSLDIRLATMQADLQLREAWIAR